MQGQNPLDEKVSHSQDHYATIDNHEAQVNDWTLAFEGILYFKFLDKILLKVKAIEVINKSYEIKKSEE